MFCPRCGKQIAREERICTNCGLNLETVNSNMNNVPGNGGFEEPPVPTDMQIIMERISTLNIKLIIFSLFALAVLILSFIAAYKISYSGSQILKIRTSDGQTVNEVYYRDMGNIYIGLAMFIRACGIFFFAVLVKLGIRSKK